MKNKFNKNETYNYTYYFADGTRSTVEVSGELYCELVKMDREEKCRRHSW